MRPAVEPVAPDRIRAVARAIARGFQDNEIWMWIIPSDRRRARVLPRYYEALIRHVFIPRGSAWATADDQGGALWLPPGRNRLAPSEQVREAVAMLPAGPGGWSRGSRSDAILKRHRPTEPHYYLSTLSIDPGHQRHGYGSALLEPMLERIDADGMPAFLETQRESNVPFYRRFGWELTDRVQIPGGPRMWLMWRAAVSPRA
jgi:GNAT superfamily N-acetyltransferase